MRSTDYETRNHAVFFSLLLLPLLRPNSILNIVFSHTINLCSSLTVTDQVSHPHRATGTLYTLSLRF